MKVEIEILKRINSMAIGTRVMIEVDRDGVAVDRFWRKRLRDCESDKCIRLVVAETVKPKKTQSTKLEDTDNGNSNS